VRILPRAFGLAALVLYVGLIAATGMVVRPPRVASARLLHHHSLYNGFRPTEALETDLATDRLNGDFYTLIEIVTVMKQQIQTTSADDEIATFNMTAYAHDNITQYVVMEAGLIQTGAGIRQWVASRPEGGVSSSMVCQSPMTVFPLGGASSACIGPIDSQLNNNAEVMSIQRLGNGWVFLMSPTTEGSPRVVAAVLIPNTFDRIVGEAAVTEVASPTYPVPHYPLNVTWANPRANAVNWPWFDSTLLDPSITPNLWDWGSTDGETPCPDYIAHWYLGRTLGTPYVWVDADTGQALIKGLTPWCNVNLANATP